MYADLVFVFRAVEILHEHGGWVVQVHKQQGVLNHRVRAGDVIFNPI